MKKKRDILDVLPGMLGVSKSYMCGPTPCVSGINISMIPLMDADTACILLEDVEEYNIIDVFEHFLNTHTLDESETVLIYLLNTKKIQRPVVILKLIKMFKEKEKEYKEVSEIFKEKPEYKEADLLGITVHELINNYAVVYNKRGDITGFVSYDDLEEYIRESEPPYDFDMIRNLINDKSNFRLLTKKGLEMRINEYRNSDESSDSE